MLCLLVVRLKRKGNFNWIEIVISLLVLYLTFQLKPNDRVFVYMLMRDVSLKQRILYIICISVFRAFSAGKKCALYTSKYSKFDTI